MASIQHPEHRFTVASVHLETLLGAPSKRTDQIEEVFSSLSSIEPLLVSGDWNTFSQRERDALSEVAKKHGLRDYTEKVGGTHPIMLWNMKLDHTVGRGFEPWASGVVSDAQGSDHWPLWFTTEL